MRTRAAFAITNGAGQRWNTERQAWVNRDLLGEFDTFATFDEANIALRDVADGQIVLMERGIENV